MKKLLKNLSFKNKLMLSYSLLIFLPVSILGIVFYKNTSQYVQSNSLEIIEQRLSQEANTVIDKISDIEKTGYLISTNSIINSFFSSNYYSEADIIQIINDRIYPLISWFEATNLDVGTIRFLTNNENIPESKFVSWDIRFNDEIWLKDLKQTLLTSTSFWEELHPHRAYFWDSTKEHSKNVFSLFYSLPRNGSEYNSYLEIETTPEYLFNAINTTAIGETGYAIVVDSSLTLLLGEEGELHNEIFASNYFDTSIDIEEQTFNITHNSNEYYIYVKEIEQLHVYILGIIPIGEFTTPISRFKNLFLLIFASGSIVIFIMSYFTSVLLLKRVKTIVNAVHRIQNEDFDINLPIEGSDEIDELAQDVNIMSNKINELINKIYKTEILQKETALNALQAQMNPHFLFNSLETIKMMAEINNEEEISDALTALGNLLRYNTNFLGNFIALNIDIENIKNYVKVQNLMLNNKLAVIYDIDSSIKEYLIPNFVLQPLIENSIVHGFKNKDDNMIIIISAKQTLKNIYITVQDNGAGFSEQKLQEINNMFISEEYSIINKNKNDSIALSNINARIKLFYKNDYFIKASNLEHGGSTITIKLPEINSQADSM